MGKKSDHSGNSGKLFALLGVFVFNFFSNAIPIIGPGLVAYSIGRSKRRWQHLGLNKLNLSVAMIIGEAFVLFAILMLARHFKDFSALITPIIIGFLTNVAVSVGAFLAGVYHCKT